LYLGNEQVAKNFDLLKRNNIKFILNVTKHIKNHFEDTEEFKYKKVPVEDAKDVSLSKYFQEAIDFIDEAIQSNDGNILVHCKQGMSRSPSVILAYLMSRDYHRKSKDLPSADTENNPNGAKRVGLSLQRSLQLLGGLENLAINDGFMEQLGVLERNLFGVNSIDFFNRRMRGARLRSPLGKISNI